MRCFYHEEKEAVGICKSCGRGLCRECAVELPKSLACRGRCEADAQAVTQLIERNIQLSTNSPQLVKLNRNGRVGTGILYIVLGTVFVFTGLRDQLNFLSVVGVGFIAFGIYTLILTWKIGKQIES